MDINFRLFDLMNKQLTENGLSEEDATSQKNYKDGLSYAELFSLDKNSDGILTQDEFSKVGNSQLFKKYVQSAQNMAVNFNLSAFGIDQLKVSDLQNVVTDTNNHGFMVITFEYQGRTFKAVEKEYGNVFTSKKAGGFNIVEVKGSNGEGTGANNKVMTETNINGKITALKDGGKNGQIADITDIKYNSDKGIKSLKCGGVTYINVAETTKPDTNGTKTYTFVPSGEGGFSQIQVSVKADGSYSFTYYKKQTVDGKQKSFKTKAVNVGADGVPTDIITYKFNKETGKNEYSKRQYLNEDRVRTFTTDKNGKITESTDRTQEGNLLSTQTYKQVDGHRVWSSRTIYDGTTKEADDAHTVEYRKYSYDKDDDGNNTKTTKLWSNKTDADAGKDPKTTTRTYTNQEGELVKAITVESNPYKRTKTEYMNGLKILVEVQDYSSDGVLPVSITRYNYNKDNSLNNVTVYDSNGKPVSEDDYIDGTLSSHADYKNGEYAHIEFYANDGKTVVSETNYDDLGRPINETYYQGWNGREEANHDVVKFTRTTAYDEEGNFISTEYNDIGNPKISRFQNAEGEVLSEVKYGNHYKGDKTVESITINLEGDLSNIKLRDYLPANLSEYAESHLNVKILSKDGTEIGTATYSDGKLGEINRHIKNYGQSNDTTNYKQVTLSEGQTLDDIDLKELGEPNGLIVVKDDQGREVGRASYDNDGKLAKLKATMFDSKTGEVLNKQVVEFDKQGRAIKINFDNVPDGLSFTNTYTYDEDGNYTMEQRDNETGKLLSTSKTTITDGNIYHIESVTYAYYDYLNGKYTENDPGKSKDVIEFIKNGSDMVHRYREDYDKDGNLASRVLYDENGKESEWQNYEIGRIYKYTNSEDGKESTTVMTDLEGNLLSTTKSKTDENGDTLITEYDSIDEADYVAYYDQNQNQLSYILCEEEDDEDYNSVRNYRLTINTSDVLNNNLEDYLPKNIDFGIENDRVEMPVYNSNGILIANILYLNGKLFNISLKDKDENDKEDKA